MHQQPLQSLGRVVPHLKAIVQPGLRTLLGAALGATLTTFLIFFPFPQGKVVCLATFPLVLVFATLMERYAGCSVIMTATWLDYLLHYPATAGNPSARSRTTWMNMIQSYFGMYLIMPMNIYVDDYMSMTISAYV